MKWAMEEVQNWVNSKWIVFLKFKEAVQGKVNIAWWDFSLKIAFYFSGFNNFFT